MNTLLARLRGRLKLARMHLADRAAARTIVSARKSGATLLDRGALVDLHDCVRNVERAGLAGMLVEAGTARGGSALVMAQAKSPARRLNLYDTFAMIPPPTRKDGDDAHARYDAIVSGAAQGSAGKQYYGYESDLFGSVQGLFSDAGLPTAENNIHLIKGLYEETMRIDAPVAMAHIDCDWYDSVIVCLEQIVPHLVSGGVLVIDDYDHWSGCKQAIDDYFASRRQEFHFQRKSRLQIVRR